MQLKIRVGASVDRSLSVAYRPLIDSAKRATDAVNREGQRAGTGVAKAHKKGTDDAEKAYAKLAKDAARMQTQMVRDAERATQAEARTKMRLYQDMERAYEKSEREKTRAAEREAAKRNRQIERELRASERASAKSSANFNRGVGRGISNVAGVGRTAARAAAGISKSILGGAGVDLGLDSHVAAGVDLEKRVVDLANAGYMPGKAGPAGIRQDASQIEAQIRKTAVATGASSGEAVEGLQAFVGKTGDLQTGRDLLFDMSKLSKATGASLEDMLDAAGDVANGLGEVDNKAEAVRKVMAAFAAQGKEGAVEIKNLASQTAGLQAAAAKFEGDGAKNLALMGGLAQMARATGGAKSAPQAVTAVQSLAAQLSKEKRLKGMAGLDVQAKTDAGFNRPLNEIIIDVLKGSEKAARAGGKGMRDFDKISMSAFADQQARRAFDPLANIYKHAGGGDAGVQAVTKALEEMTNATMDSKEITESFANAMATDATKAKQLNEALDETARDIRKELLPPLLQFAHGIAPLATDFSGWLAKKLGIKEEAAQKALHTAGVGAVNAATDLPRPGESMSPEERERRIKAAKTAHDALAAQITAQKTKVEEEGQGEHGPLGLLGLGLFRQYNQMSPEELQKEAEGDAHAQKYIEDKRALEQMNETMKRLEAAQAEQGAKFAEGLNSGPPLRVTLVGGPLALQPGGVQPPPENLPR